MNISRSKLCFSIQALNEVETSKTTCDQVRNNVQGLTGKVDKVTKDLLAKQFVIIGRVMYKDLLLLTVNKVESPIENHSMLYVTWTPCQNTVILTILQIACLQKRGLR